MKNSAIAGYGVFTHHDTNIEFVLKEGDTHKDILFKNGTKLGT